MSRPHIGTMSQLELDLATLRGLIQVLLNEGYNVGDSLGALTRLEARLEDALSPVADARNDS